MLESHASTSVLLLRECGRRQSLQAMPSPATDESLSLAALDLLLAQAPQLMTNHRDDLRALLKSDDLSSYNKTGIMRAENRFFANQVADLLPTRFVNSNRFHNRYGECAVDVVAVASQRPARTRDSIKAVSKAHMAFRARCR